MMATTTTIMTVVIVDKDAFVSLEQVLVFMFACRCPVLMI